MRQTFRKKVWDNSYTASGASSFLGLQQVWINSGNVLPPVVCIHSVQKTLKGEALLVYNIPQNHLSFSQNHNLNKIMDFWTHSPWNCHFISEKDVLWQQLPGCIGCLVVGLQQEASQRGTECFLKWHPPYTTPPDTMASSSFLPGISEFSSFNCEVKSELKRRNLLQKT